MAIKKWCDTRSKKHHCHPTKASRILMSCCRSHQRHKLRSSHILNLLGTGKRTPNSINRSYSSASVTSWLLSFSIIYYQLLLQRTLRRAFRIPVPFPVLISLILPFCHCHHSPANEHKIAWTGLILQRQLLPDYYLSTSVTTSYCYNGLYGELSESQFHSLS